MKRAGWLVMGLVALTWTAASAEMITIKVAGQSVRGEVKQATKASLVMLVGGKEQAYPAALVDTRDLIACMKSKLDPKDAKGHFEAGEFAHQKGVKDQAEELLKMAAALDKAAYGKKVEELMGAPGPVTETKPVTATKPEEPKKPDDVTAVKPEPKKGDSEEDKEGEMIVIVGPDGRKYQIPKKFEPSKKDVPARSPEVMKKFLDERLAELNKTVGGEWRLEELPHFYFFSNLPPDQHMYYKAEWEAFYRQIASIMQHKEGETLWNNKCPVYMMRTRKQFGKFTAEIDKAPGAFNSGGYFMHEGREVHIVIPLYDYMPPTHQQREATNTLYHEGTHAFVQLVGQNVRINSWLHEGIAQFIEFFKDPKNNPGRNNHVGYLRDCIRSGDIPDFEETKMRPMGGGDHPGYAWAWARVNFIYQGFPDKTFIPKIVKAIKEGKSDEEALESVTGMKMDKLDKYFKHWLDTASKRNFNP